MSERFKGGGLVIGASGFIGEATVANLKDDGEKIIAVSRTEREFDPLKGFGIERMDTTCFEDVVMTLTKYQPEYIWDFSGWSKPSDSEFDEFGARRVMIGSLENIFKAIARVQKINNTYKPKQIVVAGSVVAFGPGRVGPDGKYVNLDENSGWQPSSKYGEIKAGAADLALKLGQDSGINVIVSIQANAGGVSKYFGISQRPGFVIPDNIARVVKIMRGDWENYNSQGVPILKTGAVGQFVNITSVDQMAEVYKKLGKLKIHTKVIVGASESTQVHQIIDWIIKASKMEIEHKFPEASPPSQYYNVSKLKKLIGFVPKPLNENDIVRAVEAYKKKHDLEIVAKIA